MASESSGLRWSKLNSYHHHHHNHNHDHDYDHDYDHDVLVLLVLLLVLNSLTLFPFPYSHNSYCYYHYYDSKNLDAEKLKRGCQRILSAKGVTVRDLVQSQSVDLVTSLRQSVKILEPVRYCSRFSTS